MANTSGGIGWHGRAKFGWEFFGAELKRRREERGLSQQELGRRVFCSGSYIGQFEAGMRKPQLEIAERIDVELGTDGFFARMCRQLIDNAPYRDYFVETKYLEGIATAIHAYAPLYVPGLFQTAAYARAVMIGGFPLAPDSEIERWVSGRLERQRILEHPTEPLLWAVLDESVIRRPIGGPAVMGEQLAHLAALVDKRRIVVQVVPMRAGILTLGGLLKLMSFADAPPVAYVEGAMSGMLRDDPAQVARYQLAYDFLRATALSPAASLDLIASVAEEYADES
ncbi:helix-turn-helix transcriptional regulator [Streptomyces sp. NPDC049585]|uniref:helix-turn-helix domain-containing protein n=1 Tax=Streptomyces sp. NPDC049585 TaxID=3155154 RepID=UPI003426F734